MFWILELNGKHEINAKFNRMNTASVKNVDFLSTELFNFMCRCHGEEDNIVYDLAKDKNLLSSCPLRWDKYRFVSSDGRPLPEKISEKLSDLCMNISESDKVDEMKSYNGSLGNFIAKE